jgi:hypothetical protein
VEEEPGEEEPDEDPGVVALPGLVELGELELGDVELGEAEFEGDVLLSLSGFVEFTLFRLLFVLAPGVPEVLSGEVTPGELGVVLPGVAAPGVVAPG